LTNPQFHWADYAPSYDKPTDPYNGNPSAARITADLTALKQEGFQGVVTYTLAGSYASIPKIAKSLHFQYVIAGIYNPNDNAEVAAAKSGEVLPYADAFVVGNEGLQDRRYNIDQLTTAITTVQETGKPTTTTEPGGQYYSGANSTKLLKLGDWLFPNTDYFLWGEKPSTPQFMWTNVSYFYQFALNNNKTKGPVAIKECFFPSAGGAGASEQNQYDWYKIAYDQARAGHFAFVWGEAFDQPWKSSTDPVLAPYEPHMGLHGLNDTNGKATPKKVLDLLVKPSLVKFAKSRANVVEGRAALITLSRTGDKSRVSVVKIVVAGTSTAGRSDYAALPNGGVVRFGAGETTKTIQLKTIDDRKREAAETLVLKLQDVSGARPGSTATETVTIKDNDS
jgi:exo-beta-1,3-glucanase (GH17 family)